MFITVYYGEQESLLFNPSCSVVNLLNSIKERCGYGDTDRVLDLTDETGLVLELNNHKNEYATKFLTSKGFYILVEKMTAHLASNEPNDSGLSQDIRYVSLLQRPRDRFPNYNARVAEKNSGQLQPSGSRTASRAKKGRTRQRKSFVESNYSHAH